MRPRHHALRHLLVLAFALLAVTACGERILESAVERAAQLDEAVQRPADRPRSTFALRPVVADGTPGGEVLPHQQSADEEAVNVTLTDAVLTENDLVRVALVDEGTTGANLSLTFSDDGAARLAEYTGVHIGEEMAIVVDGKIFSVATIRDRIASDLLLSASNSTDDELRHLAEGIAP